MIGPNFGTFQRLEEPAEDGEHDGDHNRYEHHGGDWHVDPDILAFDPDVAWEPPDPAERANSDQQPHGHDDEAYEHDSEPQAAVHDLRLEPVQRQRETAIHRQPGGGRGYVRTRRRAGLGAAGT